jgi:uncharacterized membrane protein
MTLNTDQNEAGRGSALLVYALYLLSIPSAAIFALIGVIVAYASRDGAGPLARSHLEHAIRMWWTSFWWVVGGYVLIAVGFVLAFILIGFPIMWIGGLVLLIILIWFTVKALLGLLALLDGRTR